MRCRQLSVLCSRKCKKAATTKRLGVYSILVVSMVLCWLFFGTACGPGGGGGGGGGSSIELQGGSHLLICVHVDEAVEHEVDETYALLVELFRENGIEIEDSSISMGFDETFLNREDSPYKSIKNLDENPPKIEFVLAEASDIDKAKRLVKGWLYIGRNWLFNTSGQTIGLTLKKGYLLEIRRETVEQVHRSIAYRLNELGIVEPTIVIHGDPHTSQRILIQLPGIDDLEEVKTRILTAAKLEFRLVVYDEEGRPYQTDTKEELERMIDLNKPTGMAGMEIVTEYEKTVFKAEEAGEGRVEKQWYLLYKEARVNSSYLIDAVADQDQMNNWIVRFTLIEEGGKQLRSLTRANIGKLLAIVLDDQAIFVGHIKDEIGSEGQLQGRCDKVATDRLAWLLRAGALSASIHIEEARVIGDKPESTKAWPF